MAVSPETRRGRWVPRIKLYRIKNEKSNLSKKAKERMDFQVPTSVQ